MTPGLRGPLSATFGSRNGGRKSKVPLPPGGALGGSWRVGLDFLDRLGVLGQRHQVPSRGPAQPCPRDSAHPCSDTVTLSPWSLPTGYHSGSKGVLTPRPIPVTSITSPNSHNTFSLPRKQGWLLGSEMQVRKTGVAWGGVGTGSPQAFPGQTPSRPRPSTAPLSSD